MRSRLHARRRCAELVPLDRCGLNPTFDCRAARLSRLGLVPTEEGREDSVAKHAHVVDQALDRTMRGLENVARCAVRS